MTQHRRQHTIIRALRLKSVPVPRLLRVMQIWIYKQDKMKCKNFNCIIHIRYALKLMQLQMLLFYDYDLYLIDFYWQLLLNSRLIHDVFILKYTDRIIFLFWIKSIKLMEQIEKKNTKRILLRRNDEKKTSCANLIVLECLVDN